jgi:hypothetical protein
MNEQGANAVLDEWEELDLTSPDSNLMMEPFSYEYEEERGTIHPSFFEKR